MRSRVASSPDPEPILTRSSSKWLALTALFLSLGCAAVGQLERASRLREQLDDHRFAQPLDAVWPQAIKLLAERDYEVLGRDRAVVGLGPQSALGSFFQKGFETRDLGGGRRALETNPDVKMRRYRAEGTTIDAGHCRVVFYVVQAKTEDVSEDEARDIHMELALIEQVEPEVAERITAATETK